MNPDPVSQGYRMPAEWEIHSATWLTWPHNPETWPGQNLDALEDAYLQMIQALHSGERVEILVPNQNFYERAEKLLSRSDLDRSQIRLHLIPTNDSWIRDYGPNFLLTSSHTSEGTMANLWRFNSWGGKYPAELDAEAGQIILDHLGIKSFTPGIELEGGAIDVNGSGACLTTRDCLLNSNRNDGISQSEMETYLKRFLGVEEIIWCDGDLEGDDTDGHIDNLVRFVSPDSVVCAVEENPEDPNYTCTQSNLHTLLEVAASGKSSIQNVIPLPMPKPVLGDEGRLPASYANFYIGNSVILVPGYDSARDEEVADILKPHFPDRNVCLIPCRELIHGLGGPHCLTQQEPHPRNLE